MNNKKVTVIGGGHGQALMCRGLKEIEGIDLTAIVTVADDGGSTGRLRRQFHIPAMGDIRNVMVSLAASESLMRELMDYRFIDPLGTEEDIAGHNLGNLILTALTEQTGSFMEAIQEAGKVLNVKGTIIPATTEVITLYAGMDDGVIVKGEASIPGYGHHIERVFYDRTVEAQEEAVAAIEESDYVIYGIGSLYTSILPNVIIPGISEALRHTKARCIYFCNAMSQPGETDGYSMEDHVRALEDHGGRVDEVVFAEDEIPEEILKRYSNRGSTHIDMRENDHDYEVIPCQLLSFKDGYIRHDSDKIRKVSQLLLEK